jgi:hypothetical protein
MHQPTSRGPKLMLAVDPGGTTGWLLFRPVVDTSPDALMPYAIEPVEWGETRDQMRFLDQVWRWKTARLESERIDGIVIEGWRPRPGVRTWQPDAIEIIGTCRWFMDGDPARFFVQQVGDADGFGTPAKINRYRRENAPPYNVGKGGNGHAIKALQHAVLWTATRWQPLEETA